MQSYCLSFELNELPPGLNKVLRLNRWKRKELYDSVYRICNAHIAGNRPSIPLTKFTLRLTRHTTRPLDYDGLVASFKPFIDSLVKFKVIKDDSWEYMNPSNTSFDQFKVKHKKDQAVSVKVLQGFY